MKRPARLTPKLQAVLCGALERGAFLHHACALAGVHRDTVHRWLRAGEADDATDAQRDFSAAVALARVKGERYLLECMHRAAEPTIAGERQGDWRAIAWTLERLNPEKFHLPRASAAPDDVRIVEAVGARERLLAKLEHMAHVEELAAAGDSTTPAPAPARLMGSR